MLIITSSTIAIRSITISITMLITIITMHMRLNSEMLQSNGLLNLISNQRGMKIKINPKIKWRRQIKPSQQEVFQEILNLYSTLSKILKTISKTRIKICKCFQ
jgi:hypothetical protein